MCELMRLIHHNQHPVYRPSSLFSTQENFYKRVSLKSVIQQSSTERFVQKYLGDEGNLFKKYANCNFFVVVVYMYISICNIFKNFGESIQCRIMVKVMYSTHHYAHLKKINFH